MALKKSSPPPGNIWPFSEIFCFVTLRDRSPLTSSSDVANTPTKQRIARIAPHDKMWLGQSDNSAKVEKPWYLHLTQARVYLCLHEMEIQGNRTAGIIICQLNNPPTSLQFLVEGASNVCYCYHLLSAHDRSVSNTPSCAWFLLAFSILSGVDDSYPHVRLERCVTCASSHNWSRTPWTKLRPSNVCISTSEQHVQPLCPNTS
jgi:hypothetical protein